MGLDSLVVNQRDERDWCADNQSDRLSALVVIEADEVVLTPRVIRVRNRALKSSIIISQILLSPLSTGRPAEPSYFPCNDYLALHGVAWVGTAVLCYQVSWQWSITQACASDRLSDRCKATLHCGAIWHATQRYLSTGNIVYNIGFSQGHHKSYNRRTY